MTKASAVEREVNATLATINFEPYSTEQSNTARVLAGWKLVENKGFWLGTTYTLVEMSVTKDSIEFFIRSDNRWNKDAVKKIQDDLTQMAVNKFPDLKVHAVLWSSFMNGWPN